MAKRERALAAIFAEPTKANIKWAAVEALLVHPGAIVEEGEGSRVHFELDGVPWTFHRPHPPKRGSQVRGSVGTKVPNPRGLSPMKYKGYTGQVVGVDAETGVIDGEVVDIVGVITFEGDNGLDSVREFRTSVDLRLAWCARRQVKPPKPQARTTPAGSPQSPRKSAGRKAAERGVSVEKLVGEDARAVRALKTLTKVVHEAGPSVKREVSAKSSKPSA